MLFKILPFLWMAFIASVILLPTITALMGRPKGPAKAKKANPKKKKKKGAKEDEEVTSDVPPEPSLDFGDEISEMESAKG